MYILNIAPNFQRKMCFCSKIDATKEIAVKKLSAGQKNNLQKNKEVIGRSLKMAKRPTKNFNAALSAVRSGKLKTHKASVKYSVPCSTLRRHAKNLNKGEKSGPETYFTNQQESVLHDWVLDMAEVGFGFSKKQFLDAVVEFAKKKKPNFNPNWKPSNNWYEGFMVRHPDLSLRNAEMVHSRRTSVTDSDIRAWFKKTDKYIEDNNLNFMNDPTRVFNLDETAFFLVPKEKILTKKGAKQVKKKVGNNSKENLTVLLTANAAGEFAPPLLIVPKGE